MVKKYFNSIIIILMMTFSNICHSQQEYNSSILIDKFTEANNFYNNSKYEKSVEIYLEILDSGHHSAELYYNLGNSFYKLNNIANSILYYEKSLRLNPKDKDVMNNLKMVNNGIIDDIVKIPESFINNQLNNS